MKKKGLLISTIVMVVVLVASLTTATYAWFTPQNATKIEGFDVSVTSNNAVKIGVSSSGTLVAKEGLSEDKFVTGEVTYTADTTTGAFASSSAEWEGDTGLTATLNHNIQWGAQSKAVGFSATEKTAGTKDGELTVFASDSKYAYSANGSNDGSALVDLAAAIANNNGDATTPTSDYVHLTLGVAPTKALTTNQLIVLVDTNTSGGKTLGIMAALHVAFRVQTFDGTVSAWQDVDFFGTEEGGVSFATLKTAITNNLTTEQKASYKTTFGSDTLDTGVYALPITLGTNVDEIDQVEIVIYIAGEDASCNSSAISNAGGSIQLFFHTVLTEEE